MMSDRLSKEHSTSAHQMLGEGPELARMLRFRLVGNALIWIFAIAWWQSGIPVNVVPWMLNAAMALSMAVTGISIVLAERRHIPWLADAHVAADLIVMPALVWATGQWQSPFIVILVTKSVAGSLVVGPRRGILYAAGTIGISLLTWLWGIEDGTGSFLSRAAGPLLVAAIVALTGTIILQAASLPLEMYRLRRRELVSENRRLEEAIAELESQNRRVVALHGLARDIGTLGRLDEVASRLRDAVLRTFPGYSVSFFLFRRETGWLEPILLPEGAESARAARLAGPEGPLAQALGKAGPLPGGSFSLLDARNVSQILVPLNLGEKPVGMMVLEDRVETFLQDADRQLLATMGSEMAVALRNAELHARSVELRDSLESLIDHANALILVVDPLGTVEVANKAFAELASQPGTTPVGHAAAELFTLESAADFGRAMEIVRGGRPVENLALSIRSGQDGKAGERRAAFNLAPVQDRDGGFRATIAVGQDITRMELLERQIVQSEKLASLGQFVAGIAHEMNNPLTAITAYGDYLRTAHRKGQPVQDAAEKLDNIVSAGERIQGFVQSLLGLARPSGGKRRDLDVNSVVKDAVRLCQFDLKKTSVDVKTELAPELPWIAGVEAELQQVFINLFVNASHAIAPPIAGELRIRTLATDTGVRVSVTDNGSGIPAEVLPQIFEAFFTTKTEGRGTGLGLSIVKKIVEQHGGRISVDSTQGKGTTFHLDFPSAAATAASRQA